MSSPVFRMGVGAPLVTNMGGPGASVSGKMYGTPIQDTWGTGRLHVLPYCTRTVTLALYNTNTGTGTYTVQ